MLKKRTMADWYNRGRTFTKQLPVKVSEEQLERWRAIADREEMTLAEWVRQALDASASGYP